MPTAAVLATNTGLTGLPLIISIERFNFGSVGFTSDEPFYLQAPSAYIEVVETFWMYGSAAIDSVEPFDFGEKLAWEWTEPFNLADAGDSYYDPIDLGDGETVTAPAVLQYGWWLPDVDEFESLGTMATD